MSLKHIIEDALTENSILQKFINWLAKPRIVRIKIPFLKSSYEKIDILREKYMRQYKAEEMSAKTVTIPYFLRASQKITAIIKNNQIDFEYKKYCREQVKKKGE